MGEYAPYAVTTDARDWGLVETRLNTDIGTTIVRHAAHRESPRATVFLHGAAGSWTTWTPVLAAARARGVTIPDPVLLDLAGWGDGTARPDATPTIESVCNTVIAALDELGYSGADVVGHSMGGFIAMNVAAAHGSRVRSIGLISTTAWSVVESVHHPLGRHAPLPGFVGLRYVMRVLAALGPAGGRVVRVLGMLGLLRLAVAPLFRHPWRLPTSVIGALEREVRPRSFVRALALVRGFDVHAAWGGISCPVWAVNGDRDVLAHRDDLTRLESLLPQARTTTIADCGHFATVEHPDQIVDRLVG